MKFNSLLLGLVVCTISMTACVSSKKFKAEQARYAELTEAHNKLRSDVQSCETDKAALAREKEAMQQRMQTDIDALNKQMGFLKENNTQALRQLQDLW